MFSVTPNLHPTGTVIGRGGGLEALRPVRYAWDDIEIPVLTRSDVSGPIIERGTGNIEVGVQTTPTQAWYAWIAGDLLNDSLGNPRQARLAPQCLICLEDNDKHFNDEGIKDTFVLVHTDTDPLHIYAFSCVEHWLIDHQTDPLLNSEVRGVYRLNQENLSSLMVLDNAELAHSSSHPQDSQVPKITIQPSDKIHLFVESVGGRVSYTRRLVCELAKGAAIGSGIGLIVNCIEGVVVVVAESRSNEEVRVSSETLFMIFLVTTLGAALLGSSIMAINELRFLRE
jgi:hypothetical protein